MSATSKPAAAPVMARHDRFQRLLLEVSAAVTKGGDFRALAAPFCRATRDYFGTSAVFCWQLQGDEIVGLEGDGLYAERFRGLRVRLDESAVATASVLERRTVYVNGVDPEQYPLVRQFPFTSILSAPLMSGGDVIGVICLAHECDSEFFNDDIADKVTILTGLLANLVAAASQANSATEERSRAENLMALALELSASIRLPQFASRFTEHAAAMLGSKTAALALVQGGGLETLVVHAPGQEISRATQRHLNAALGGFSAGHHQPVTHGSAHALLGTETADALGWSDVTLVRLSGTDGALVGILCLADRGMPLSASDSKLLQALIGHATIALENSRLFTRIDQANRHWVEIFDAISDFIIVHDDRNRVLRLNRPLAEFIGVRPSELIGLTMQAVMSFATVASAQTCPLCRSGQEGADEYTHTMLERMYLVSTSRLQGAPHEGPQTIHVLKDITDRREAERRYRELFDNIQEGLFFSTPEGRFVEVNDALVRILGYASRDELLGADIPREIYGEPSQRARFQARLEQHGTVRNYEESLRRRDGSVVHTLQNAFAVRDSRGQIVQYRGLILDITDLKNFQAELQRERDFSSKILNNTQSLILVVDTAGLISYANRRWFDAAEYRQDTLLGIPLLRLAPENRREQLKTALESTLAGQQVDNLDLPLVRGDGSVGQFSINLSPMRDEAGHLTSIVAVMTDVSDAAVLKAKLMHTEKMAAIGQLVSGVAHEVNNPLTAILGFADLLLEYPEIPATARNELQIIVQEAQRTKLIVQNLLSFARQVPPQRQAVQVNDIVRRTLQLRSYDFNNHGVEVIERLDPKLPVIVADGHQLQQVLLNIVNNAYDAVRVGSQRGRITVETEHAGEHVEIRCRDNGHGVVHPERIFDPFFTTKEVGKGTGLGLSICYGVVREHGGEITCHNNTNGEGATFVVRLPLAARAAARGEQ